MSDTGETKRLSRQVQSLAGELRLLRSEMAGLVTSVSRVAPQPAQVAQTRVRVSIARVPNERKPFVFSFQGRTSYTESLSATRTAISLILLLDLQDRAAGGAGLADFTQLLSETYLILRPETRDRSDVENVLRAGMHRFRESVGSDDDSITGDLFVFDFKTDRLHFSEEYEGTLLEVTTNDPLLQAIVDRTLEASPIMKLRRRKALYVPSGAESYDRFLLELYEHADPMTVTILYFRPSIQSYPATLLRKIGYSDNMVRRQEIVVEGYRTGRVVFNEILNRDTIWDLIRLTPDGSFLYYPRHITVEDVADHLNFLVYSIDHYQHYHLMLTDAPFPFHLATYEIKDLTVGEKISVFFRRSGSAHVNDVGCFAVSEYLAFKSISEHIFEPILRHPSTTIKPREVRREILKVRDHLLAKGPLSPAQETNN